LDGRQKIDGAAVRFVEQGRRRERLKSPRRKVMVAPKKPKRPPLCEECGIYRSDPPSRLCPGCQAYGEHQR
jgi:hypothetical protein